VAGPSFAQLEENILGLDDDNLEAYLHPLNIGLSATMSSAVFRTGHVPKSGLTFSVGVAAMAVGFADEDRTYLPTDPPGFTSLEPTMAPTVIGDPGGVVVAGESGLMQGYPGGFDLGGFEIAVPQVSVGAVLGTRAVARYIAADLGDSELGDFSCFGIGAQHSISQWIPSLPLDVAVGLFFHSFDIGDDLISASARQLNLTASKEFGVLQPYAGIGYDSIETDVKCEDEDVPESSIAVTLEKESHMHLTLGVLVRLSVVAAFFEFNSAEASGFAFGVDFGM
jgi:hypothetical protein